MENIFAVYKPKGPTSHDIIDQLRKITGERRIGHAGTLDPLAEGVLVVGIGREALKKMNDLVQHEKEYIATVRLGMTSTTDDEEGAKTTVANGSTFQHPTRACRQMLQNVIPAKAGIHNSAYLRDAMDSRFRGNDKNAYSTTVPTQPQITASLQRFLGRIQQRPPAYSAIKINGVPAYKLARQGRPVDLPAREVECKELELLEYNWPDVKIRLVTGPGFYVRSFARDLGEALGVGGYLAGLTRTRVGEFGIEEAMKMIER